MQDNNIKILIEAVDKATAPIKKMNKSIADSMNWIMEKARGASLVVGGLFAGIATYGIDSARQVESVSVAFENLYGDSKKAGDMMKKLTDFSAKTPFEFGEVSSMALKLKNVAGVGDDELIPMLTKLGDIASSQGKTLEMSVEAFNDAITGEFERLKEFGIVAKQNWDKVALTFRGQTVEVAKTKEWISQYLQKIWEMQGIAWGMEKQSATLGGQLSTLKDNIAWVTREFIWMNAEWKVVEWSLYATITKTITSINDFISKNSELVGTIATIVASIGGLVLVLGWLSFAINGVVYILGAVSTALTVLWVTVSVAVAPIYLVIAALWALVLAWIHVYNNWEAFKNAYALIWEDIKTGIFSVTDAISSYFSEKWQAMGEWMSAKMTEIKTNASIIWNQIKVDLSSIVDTIKGNFLAWWENIRLNIANTITNILTIIGTFWQTIIDLVTWARDSIVWAFQSVWDGVYNSTMTVFNNISNFVNDKLQWMSAKLQNLRDIAREIGSLGTADTQTFNGWGVQGARALGWSVTGNKPYLIGERGPEIFVPNGSGRVVANNQIGWGGISLTFGDVTITNGMDMDAFASRIKREITRSIELTKYWIV